MKVSHLAGAVLFWLVLVSLRASAPPLPGVNAKWTHYASANFELYSQGRDVESREILTMLETLRLVMLEQRDMVETARMPLTLFFFGRTQDFKFYGGANKEVDYVASYSDSLDRARVFLSPDADQDLENSVYFSYLFHASTVTQQEMPAWLKRGLAGVYSSVKSANKDLQFGLAPEWRVGMAQKRGLKPIEAFFRQGLYEPKFKKNEDLEQFSSQCWLMTHFMLFSKGQIADGAGKKFIDWASTHPYATIAEIHDAFVRHFSMEFSRMDAMLQDYLRGGRFGWGDMPRPNVPSPKTIQSRKVPEAEILLRLAEAAVLSADSGAGKLMLLTEGDKSRDPRVFEALGAAAAAERDDLNRDENWQKAIDLGSTNPQVKRRLLERRLWSWLVNFSPEFVFPPDAVSSLRATADSLLAENPNDSVALEVIAWLNAFSPKPNIQELKLIQSKIKLFAEPDRILVALATVCYRAQQTEQLDQLVLTVNRMDSSSWSQRCIELLRARAAKATPDFSKVRPSRKEQLASQVKVGL
jgi:hypothetical protein